MSYTIHPARSGVQMILGPTEHEVMNVLWQLQRASVRQVYATIVQRRPVAYTTIGTTMTRLAEKGLLRTRQLRRRGQPLLYRVSVSQADLEAQLVGDTLAALQREYPTLVEAWIDARLRVEG